MAGPRKPRAQKRAASEEDEPQFPSAEERKGMRGHDEQGNVRPADGRWDLHKPADESKVSAQAKDAK